MRGMIEYDFWGHDQRKAIGIEVEENDEHNSSQNV